MGQIAALVALYLWRCLCLDSYLKDAKKLCAWRNITKSSSRGIPEYRSKIAFHRQGKLKQENKNK
jgi:hypothetical protein